MLNTFKTMIQDDDVLEEKDMYVLERLAEFVKREEVQGMAAGKQLGVSIERTVRALSSSSHPFTLPLFFLYSYFLAFFALPLSLYDEVLMLCVAERR